MLLRGINVGGRNKLPMAELRTLLAEAGAEQVATYIQSGNAVLASSEPPDVLALEISERISAAVGFAPGVVVRRASELAEVVAGNPFPEQEDPTKLVVAFCEHEPSPEALADVDLDAYLPERAVLRGRHLYLDLPEGQGRATLPAALDRALGVPMTARNWRTVVKLAEMVDALGR